MMTKIPIYKYFQLLRKYLLPLRVEMLALAFTLLAYIGLSLYAPQFLKRFLNQVVEGGATVELIWLAVAFGIANLSFRAVEVLTTYLTGRVSWAATNALREDFMKHCLSMSMPFHHGKTPGEMIERIDGDISNLREFFSTFVTRLLGSALLLIGILVFLFLENLVVGAIFSLFSILTLVVCGYIRVKGVPAQIETREASSQMFGHLEQRIEGAEDTRSSGGVSYALNKFEELSFIHFIKGAKAAAINACMMNLAWLLFYAANASALGISAYFFIKGEITLGAVYVIYHYVSMLRNPIEGFVREFENLTKADASIVRIDETLNSDLCDIDEGDTTPDTEAMSVEFVNVTLCYDGKTKALDSVSFKLEKGVSLGLIGETGSGKSSIARLLFRFYEPTNGQIILSGKPANEMRLKQLRNQIVFASQEAEIFEASVFDNVTLFDSSHSRERVRNEINRVGLGAWLDRLPDGLDTMLGHGAVGLSSGQRQMLSMTRAFLKKSSLVILDEPTADLDPTTEEMFTKSLHNLLVGRTVIVIAHRLKTLNLIDQIAVLNRGKLIEYGKRSDLEKDSGSKYAKVLASQKGGLTT